ncbi:hypothetical protein [Camelimonas lactis]|uniref:Uncharacterized protein n=1 Tax=Camelimonas lactis TaxID=659006 RepID=A0A4R2GGW1_9HYPH|nr:hypothetical protein [Camelimonas lactis]TCO07602.1 hypothetical protein EV666_13013 [Camelimonas lactis]
MTITSTYTLTRPITLPNGAILGKVEIRPMKAADLMKIGDDIRVVTSHFMEAAEATKLGKLPNIAGSAEYAAMLSIIRGMTSLGDDAGEVSADDIDGLVAAVLFTDEAAPGES